MAGDTTEKPKHHQTPLIKIDVIKNHPGADLLEIIPIEGYQAVVKKDSFHIGDWGVYLYPDSLAPIRKEFEFLFVNAYENGILRDGMKEVPAKYRRIRAKKLRGIWSEGLLLPAREFPEFMFDGMGVPCYNGKVAPNDVSEILKIEHYQPPDPEDLRGQNERGPKSPYPRSIKGWLWWLGYKIAGLFGYYDPTRGSNERGPKHEPSFYDIENSKNFKSAFQEGDEIIVTEKIHGSQFRAVYRDGHFYVGSRRLWKHPKSKDIWRKAAEQNPWIEKFCRENEGRILYGEVVPTQGDSFRYGCKPGELKVFVFDVKDKRDFWNKDYLFCHSIFEHGVPMLFMGHYQEDHIKSLVEGKSEVDNTTIREGIVISSATEKHVHGLGRLQLKRVSNEFLIKS